MASLVAASIVAVGGAFIGNSPETIDLIRPRVDQFPGCAYPYPAHVMVL
jgi:hypothetical protein